MRTALVIIFVFLITGLAALVVSSPGVYADSGDAWLDHSASIIARNPITASNESRICSGTLLPIEIVGNGMFKDSCVYGDPEALRVARFFTGTTYLYAVAFPHDERYYELRGGCPLARCVYASGTDTLISHKNITPYIYGGVLYKNFSQHLERRFDAAKQSYYFRFAAPPPDYTVMMGTYQPAVESITLSRNGKWALFELKAYGIVRLNVTTLEAQRVIAPGADYGLGRDPAYELAISDNGREVVAMGQGVGIQFIAVNDTCGDRLVEGMEPRYASTIIPCERVSLSAAGLPQSYDYFTKPRFDASGTRLGFTIRYRDASAERVILSPDSATPGHQIDYLALGDSFTSGEGEIRDSYYRLLSTKEPTRCHVSVRSYPYLLGSLWGGETENVACSGARTVDILRASAYAGQGDALLNLDADERQQLINTALTNFRSGVVAQEEFVGRYQPRVVTVGVGGNDAGLVGKLSACLGIGTCEWVNDPAKRAATAREIAALYPKIQQVIEALRNDSPQSRILMVGYPQIINARPNATCDIVTGTLLNTDERKFIWETIHYLNKVIAAAAYAQSAAFADIEQSFAGYELCQGAPSSAMNGVRFGGDIAPIKALSEFRIFGAESFHPTPQGHQLTAQTLFGAYPSWETIKVCETECESRARLPDPSAYWHVEAPEAAGIQQRYDPMISKAIVRPGALLEIFTSSLQFMPESTVTIELHSEPLVLGEGKADAQGALTYTATIPSELPQGYHTLHLVGTSTAGEPLDLYRTIAVTDESPEQPEAVAGVAPPRTSQADSISSTKEVSAVLNNTATAAVFLPKGSLADMTGREAVFEQILGAMDATQHQHFANASQNPSQSQESSSGTEYTFVWVCIIAACIGAGILILYSRWHVRYSSRDRS